MALERWLDIFGYVGAYQVSDHGRVYSVPRRRNVGNGTRMLRGRTLRRKPGIYPSVTLAKFGENTTHNIHSLVLEAFVGPRPAGMEACHYDGDKWNCRLDNLRWDTPSGNHADRVRHGVSNRGDRCGTAKLTEHQVGEIRNRYSAGEKQRAIAFAYGVTPPLISLIVNNKRWSYASA